MEFEEEKTKITQRVVIVDDRPQELSDLGRIIPDLEGSKPHTRGSSMLCTEYATTTTSAAEVMLDNGRRAQQFLRQGGTVSQFVSRERVEPHRIHLVLAWVEAVNKNPAMYIKADLENWSDHQIAASISICTPANAGVYRPIFRTPPKYTLIERATVNGMATMMVGGLATLACVAVGIAMICHLTK